MINELMKNVNIINSSTSNIESSYFPALTGIRVIAAYMVYIHHYNLFTVESFGYVVHYFFHSFHVGVTLFFVLSGFLIANRYFDLNSFNYKLYLQKRFARIYPIYFILTTLTFISGYFFTKSYGSFSTYFVNITFLKGFFDDLKFTGISQGWTLTVEEAFYFLAPLFFILIKRKKWMLILLPVVFMALGVLLVLICENFNLHGFMNNFNFMLGFTFFGRISEFFVGISLSILIMKNRNFKFKNFTILGIFGSISSIYLLSVLEQHPASELLFVEKAMVNSLLLPIIGIAPLFYGLITEKTVLSKILSSAFLILLGKSSYVFYLVHMGIIRTLFETITQNYWMVFLALNVISIGIYFFIEKPLNRFFRQLGS